MFRKRHNKVVPLIEEVINPDKDNDGKSEFSTHFDVNTDTYFLDDDDDLPPVKENINSSPKRSEFKQPVKEPGEIDIALVEGGPYLLRFLDVETKNQTEREKTIEATKEFMEENLSSLISYIVDDLTKTIESNKNKKSERVTDPFISDKSSPLKIKNFLQLVKTLPLSMLQNEKTKSIWENYEWPEEPGFKLEDPKDKKNEPSDNDPVFDALEFYTILVGMKIYIDRYFNLQNRDLLTWNNVNKLLLISLILSQKNTSDIPLESADFGKLAVMENDDTKLLEHPLSKEGTNELNYLEHKFLKRINFLLDIDHAEFLEFQNTFKQSDVLRSEKILDLINNEVDAIITKLITNKKNSLEVASLIDEERNDNDLYLVIDKKLINVTSLLNNKNFLEHESKPINQLNVLLDLASGIIESRETGNYRQAFHFLNDFIKDKKTKELFSVSTVKKLFSPSPKDKSLFSKLQEFTANEKEVEPQKSLKK